MRGMRPDDKAAIGLSRRSLLSGTIAALGTMTSGRAAPSARAFRISLSVSPFTEMVLAQGIHFTDGQREARTAEEVQRLFLAHGATEVYARIGTRRKFTPGNGDHGVERGL